MPFGLYDVEGEIIQLYRENNISVIVLLAEEVECLQKAKRNLYDFYLEQGFRVIHLPIADFNIPPIEELARAVNQTIEFARAGRNVAIHCSGGIGRTGTFAACMAKKLFSLPSDQAIAWVRRYITSALETAEQEQLVMDYETETG
ncbi:MAG: dual specificity protein phosphatase family protein [Syntrophorhabdales bacterium]|jgi:protein-tyrosine phosphatase